MFRFCDGEGDKKKYQKRLKKIARRVQKGLIQDYTFFNMTDEQIEEQLTTGKSTYCHTEPYESYDMIWTISERLLESDFRR